MTTTGYTWLRSHLSNSWALVIIFLLTRQTAKQAIDISNKRKFNGLQRVAGSESTHYEKKPRFPFDWSTKDSCWNRYAVSFGSPVSWSYFGRLVVGCQIGCSSCLSGWPHVFMHMCMAHYFYHYYSCIMSHRSVCRRRDKIMFYIYIYKSLSRCKHPAKN